MNRSNQQLLMNKFIRDMIKNFKETIYYIPQFLPNPADILAIFPIHEYEKLPEYRLDWIKIVDFYYWLISGPVPFFSYKSLCSFFIFHS